MLLAPPCLRPCSLMDLADLASVRAAARRVEKAHGKSLSLLVNNAGVMATPYERTGDGHWSGSGSLCRLAESTPPGSRMAPRPAPTESDGDGRP